MVKILLFTYLDDDKPEYLVFLDTDDDPVDYARPGAVLHSICSLPDIKLPIAFGDVYTLDRQSLWTVSP